MTIFQNNKNYLTFHYTFIGAYGSLILTYLLFISITIAAFTILTVKDVETQNILDNGALLGVEDDEEERQYVKKTNTSYKFIISSMIIILMLLLIGIIYIAPSLGHIIIAATNATTSYDWYDYAISLLRMFILLIFSLVVIIIFFFEETTHPEASKIQ